MNEITSYVQRSTVIFLFLMASNMLKITENMESLTAAVLQCHLQTQKISYQVSMKISDCCSSDYCY